MKPLQRSACLAFTLLAAPLCLAQVSVQYDFNDINLDIPDADLSGLSDSRTVSSPYTSILSVSVTLTLEGTGDGAFSGDYYAYLSHGDNIAILLNRVGRTADNPFGYADNGFDAVTFRDDAANGDVHLYQTVSIPSGNGPLTGIWAPDGRNESPLSVLDSSPRTTTLANLSGLNPNGEWTLFIADLNGGGSGRLAGWSMTLTTTAVPEPETCAAVGGLLLLGFAVWRKRQAPANPHP